MAFWSWSWDILTDLFRPQPRLPQPGPKPNPPVFDLAVIRQAVIDSHNLARRAARAVSLGSNPKLERIAQDHVEVEVVVGRMDHRGLGDGSFAQRIANSEYRYSRAAENLGLGYSTGAALVEAWLRDPPHRLNVLNPDLDHIGVGVAFDAKGVPYWCVVYGSPIFGVGIATFQQVESDLTSGDPPIVRWQDAGQIIDPVNLEFVP